MSFGGIYKKIEEPEGYEALVRNEKYTGEVTYSIDAYDTTPNIISINGFKRVSERITFHNLLIDFLNDFNDDEGLYLWAGTFCNFNFRGIKKQL